MMSRPSSVSSWAMIEPVQPSPMMTTSLRGSRRAISVSPCPRRPVRAAGQADRRQRKGLVVAVHPVEIVVASAWIADHFPGDHVAIAAIDRVGEKTHLHILDGLFEEPLAVDAV